MKHSATADAAPHAAQQNPAGPASTPAPASHEPPGAKRRAGSEPAAKLRTCKEAAASLPEPGDGGSGPHTIVALLGHSGSGKSTALGALMRAAGAWDARALQKFEKERQDVAKGMASAASVPLETRRESLDADGRRLTILDVPGHPRCVPLAWAAVTHADTAVLVVSAQDKELKAGLAHGGQTLEHAILAKGAGVERLVVLVNKMDLGEAAWSSSLFEEVSCQVAAALLAVGVEDSQLKFVPGSASSPGRNIGRLRDKQADWYDGEALLHVLETCSLPERQSSGPLRIAVSGGGAKRGNAIYVDGYVEEGSVEVGDALTRLPPTQQPAAKASAAGFGESAISATCNVHAVGVGGRDVRHARAGELVRLKLDGGSHIGAGHVLCCPEDPVRSVSKFKAQLRLLDVVDDALVTVGFRCMLHAHQAVRECEVSKIVEATDPRTGQKEISPKVVRAPLDVLAVLTIRDGLGVQVGTGDGSRLARLCLRVDGGTIAFGRVTEVPKAK